MGLTTLNKSERRIPQSQLGGLMTKIPSIEVTIPLVPIPTTALGLMIKTGTLGMR